jgi:hypothetical protein
MESQSLLIPILVLVASLIVLISYLSTLQRALKKCAPASRAMKPGEVWFVLIPILGLVWHFVVVMYITESLRNEFRRIEAPCTDPTFGRTIGLAHCVCSLCLVFLPYVGRLLAWPVVFVLLGRFLAAIPSLVLWIAYWNRVTNYSHVLDAHQAIVPALPLS